MQQYLDFLDHVMASRTDRGDRTGTAMRPVDIFLGVTNFLGITVRSSERVH
nr:hypothetical protein [Ensifer adhaerens]